MPRSNPTWQFAWASLTGCRSAPTEIRPVTTSVTVLDWCSTSKLIRALTSDLVKHLRWGRHCRPPFFALIRPLLLRLRAYPAARQLCVENPLPGAKVQLTCGDWHDHFV